MNIPNPADFKEKKCRLRTYMAQNGYGAAILGRRDNIAWFTCGGDFKVLRDTEAAFGMLLVTQSNVYLISQYMDLDRIYDDELEGLDIEKVKLFWYEESMAEKAVQLAGKVKIVSDMPIGGADLRLWDIYWLHYPLTVNEIEQYRENAKKCDELLYGIAQSVKPGMTENQIEADVLYAYAKENFLIKVLLVGSDGRISQYRHPGPSPKKLEKLLLIHPSGQKNGLHVNLTRMVCFGDIPENLKRKYGVLNLLEAQAMAMTRPGEKFSALFEERKRLLKEYGFGEEWRYHYHGAITGYILGTAQPFLDDETMRNAMSMEYFITLEGAKVEEVCISGVGGAELISSGYAWPTKKYAYNNNSYNLPVILQR